MNLLREAQMYLVRQQRLHPDDEDGCIHEVNAMNNYEFLELLDAIFDEAVMGVSR